MAALCAPGNIPKILDIEPIFFMACNCSRKSSKVNFSPATNLASSFCALSPSSPSSAFFACSARVATSPIPKMRFAIRSGWNGSNSLLFSPVDKNITGLPVTDAIESAAPPLASPSILVSTIPSKPTPSRNACAVFTAS